MQRGVPRLFVKQVLIAITMAGIFASVALAHHGWTGYDENQTLNLTGTIQDSGWDNPHGFVHLQVHGEKGKTWLVVLAPPSRMESRGLARESLKAGATATLVGYPNRTKPDELRAERIMIDGKTTELR